MNVLRSVGRCLLFVVLFSMPIQVQALGFGTITLESHLNQNLKASIPILLNASDDMNTIRVELATADEYKQLGLQWQAELALIRVSLREKHSKQPMVQLSSAVLMHAPMLSILLKAKKSGRGTYFKHYQLLLDSAEIQALRARQPVLMAIRPQSEPAAATLASVDDGAWARIWRYGPVQRGDSLSEIAYRLRLDKRYSNRQVMLSLYENNRAAFGDGDINRLIKGVWLNVPAAEVVEQFSSQAAMKKLTKLLTRQHVAGNADGKVELDAAKTIKADALKTGVAKSDAGQGKSHKPDTKKKTSASLRYSGKISMQGMDNANTVAALKQDFDQQFGSIHQRMMDGKLQMAKLDETVTGLHVSMQVVKQDIQVIKRDIAIIKMRTDGPTNMSLMTWQLVLIVVLMLIIALLLLMLLRKNKNDSNAVPLMVDQIDGHETDAHETDAHEADAHETDAKDLQYADVQEHASEHDSQGDRHGDRYGDRYGDKVGDKTEDESKDESKDKTEPQGQHQNKELELLPALESPVSKPADDASVLPQLSLSHESAPLAEAVIQLLNQVEESLGQCDFDKAEEMLHQVQGKWPDSLRASALQAQLFYETDRLGEMNDLINNISTTSDEQRWEQFCYFLPSHVWNACFGDGASAISQRPDQA